MPPGEPISDAGLEAIEAHLLAVTDVATADWATSQHLTIRLSVDEVRGPARPDTGQRTPLSRGGGGGANRRAVPRLRQLLRGGWSDQVAYGGGCRARTCPVACGVRSQVGGQGRYPWVDHYDHYDHYDYYDSATATYHDGPAKHHDLGTGHLQGGTDHDTAADPDHYRRPDHHDDPAMRGRTNDHS